MDIIAVDLCTVSNGDVDFGNLNRLGNVTYYDVLSPDELIAAAKNARALLVNKAEVTRELLDACRRLEYVGTFSTGYNNIDLTACARRGVTVCNVPDYSTNAVCQHVFALLLNHVGSIDRYAASVAAGDWIRSKTFCYMAYPAREIYGKTFGVYGYGNIGKAVARVAQAFGMKVLVCTRTAPKDCPYEVVDGDEIFRRSDFLSLHCPLNRETARLVNARTLSLMKRDAVIVNTARGGLIDENALAQALAAGKIGGACLDVLTREPMSPDCPLYGVPGVVFTPHVAWIPRETRQRLADAVADNLRAYLDGAPRNVVT